MTRALCSIVVALLPFLLVQALRAQPVQRPAAPSPKFSEDELRRGVESLRAGGNPFPELITRTGPGLFKVGTVSLDTNAKRVAVPGRINMTQGIIEYLAVVDGRGKTHESVLALEVQPSLLQFALILLGYEQGEIDPGDVATRRPPSFAKWGEPLALTVEWDRDGKTERALAESFVFNRETQSALTGMRWHFTGSFFSRRGFAADNTGSVVATFLDVRAMINTANQIGNPYRGASKGYEINAKVMPPVNTPIRLVFESARPPAR
jgi:hypothetical protein